ncbi:hypothetical protein Barb6_00212 [Bacteroidales bacterium Barb6]|nr:hypothetical protein Barb6_00212 [Bacteroidales bacterium Barb6]
MEWWTDMMPIQTEYETNNTSSPKENKIIDANQIVLENNNRVMLIRQRISRIFYLHKFFDYPISLKWETFQNMGFVRTIKAGIGYIYSVLFKKEEHSLEDFYINRFGKPLYRMFFEDYTEKVWGVHPSKLGADWGSQRVKGLSLLTILKDIFKKKIFSMNDVDQKDIETSLIERFIYPKYGPGQLWEIIAKEIGKLSGKLYMNQEIFRINIEDMKIVSVDIRLDDGEERNQPCDYFLSSMPIKDLFAAFSGIKIPEPIMQIAAGLQYRDFITVGLLVNKLKIKNKTKIKTYQERIPDTWIYIQERDVKIGRLQIFNNWSPYLVADYENTLWIGLEYFCTEGDELWSMEKNDFIKMAIQELVKMDVLSENEVLDSIQIKVKKAYPSYFGSYHQFDEVKLFLDKITNLYCIGRNGQHRYNNMDHSMKTAMIAVNNIQNGVNSKENLWSVNTEVEYHETKK